MIAELERRYPILTELPPATRGELSRTLRWLELPDSAMVFDERQACTGFPLVVRGAVRVSKLAPNGRAITLYRVAPGESCIITTSCLLASSVYNARGQTEGPTALALVPGALFDVWLAEPPFRRFVFGLFADRIADLMQLVEAVAFRRLDQRLAALLRERGPTVLATHQQLADELGSAREIVSRLLKHLAEDGAIAVRRERIDVLDADALRRWADGSP